MKLNNVIAVRASKTVYREENVAVKVFDEHYSKADILNEALNLARIEETGLNVPQVLEVTKLDGKWAIITTFIEGKTLAALMEEHPEKQEEYLRMFVDLQLHMHRQTAPDLNKLKDKMHRKILQADLDPHCRYELHTRLEAMPKHNKVCHGDFNPSNIIVTADGTPFILDWSHATQGNASADAARTYLLFCLAGKQDTAEQYLTLFCQKSGTAMRYVQQWMPIVAASQSVKGNPDEREFLLSWANIADYE